MDNANISFSLGEYRNSIISALDKMRRDNIIARIWAKDYTVWKPAPDEIINRLGWLDAPAETLEKINYIRAPLNHLPTAALTMLFCWEWVDRVWLRKYSIKYSAVRLVIPNYISWIPPTRF